MMADRYNPQEIEPKWQQRWEADQLYQTEPAGEKPKYYILDFYPYPSGEGMSVGHARNYVPTDVIARYYRMKGYNVLHPMGFDAFGLPTENAAIKLKVDPHGLNEKYSANYVRQYKLMGLSYDWSRLINSAHDDYYKWTQWIFIQLFNSWYDPRKDKASPISELEAELSERGAQAIFDFIDTHAEFAAVVNKGTPAITAEQWRSMSRREQNDYLSNFRLAFQQESTVNWDPQDKVVVADEEVENGRAWRSGALVIKRTIRQWFFRIPAYAERLINDLDTVDWPERIVTMQRNWIGKSEGAEVDFEVESSEFRVPSDSPQNSELGARNSIRVFTTRPDTLWGATFMVLSPEHPLVSKVVSVEQRAAVEQYVAMAKGETEEQRTAEGKEKTGIFTGAYAINPVNKERVPIWIADYVLMGYGTGAIMAVPAHDQRDFDFARKFNLPVKVVVMPPDRVIDGDTMEQAYEDKQGTMVDSGPITGMSTGEDGKACIRAATDYCEEMGFGKRRVNYRIRPWLISRQRYWGTPIPIVHTPDGPQTMSENELPLLLPKVKDYEPGPNGESPLASIPEFVHAPNGERETDTMATWACSSWYYIRFADPHNNAMIGRSEEIDYWLPVDMYVGGAEHAVLHLLYARMWTKVLYDIGTVKFIEPFKSLRNQGMILSPQKKVDEKGREFYEKMSKSKGNVITPDEVIAEHGADALRGYEMFISDFTQTVPWSTQGVPGVRRWLDRVWRIVLSPNEDKGPAAQMSEKELRRAAHQAIMRYERDLKAFSFNTMVAAMMEFTNTIYKARDAGLSGTPAWNESIDILVKLLAPIAPHVAEELWSRMGNAYSIHKVDFPVADEAAAKEDEITVVVQVNGKVRDRVTVPANADDDTVKQAALATDGAKRFINGSSPRQVIYVKGRLVNIVM
jgi:leucyl-tRNA synthetase